MVIILNHDVVYPDVFMFFLPQETGGDGQHNPKLPQWYSCAEMAAAVTCGAREAAGDLLRIREHLFPYPMSSPGNFDGPTWICTCKLKRPLSTSTAQEGV